MVIGPNVTILFLLSMIAVTSNGQEAPSPSLNIGDPAPPMLVRKWLKGVPVQGFEKDKVYVVEFWATWCNHCIAAMPYLSGLACEYKDRVTILGIDILEEKTTSMEKVKTFVDSMGHRMDYHVAAEDSNFMTTSWLYASGQQGIPATYVVNQEGRVAWIGNPKGLDEILPKILKHTWDIKQALAKRKLDMHLEKLDEQASYELSAYTHVPEEPVDVEKADSALIVINEIVRKEPNLKYGPSITAHSFSSLLITNPHKAYEYGKMVLMKSTYDLPLYYIIFGNINSWSNKLNLPPEIYQLGAEAYQAQLNTYPENYDIPKTYHKMAEWYWRANNKSKAIDAQKKAIEALKSKKDFSATDLAAFESQLQQYKNM